MSAHYLEKFISASHGTWYGNWSYTVDNPIHFEVTRSKVKVTVAFYTKSMSAQYLDQFMSDSHSTF